MCTWEMGDWRGLGLIERAVVTIEQPASSNVKMSLCLTGVERDGGYPKLKEADWFNIKLFNVLGRNIPLSLMIHILTKYSTHFADEFPE